MKIVRFLDKEGKTRLGEPVGEDRARVLCGELFGTLDRTDETVQIERLLAPIEPRNVIAIGLNYKQHAEESGAKVPDYPAIFVKLTTAVAGPNDPIVLPEDAPDEVDFEAELGVVIGKTARQISESEALNYVLGYTCANDVSARDCQIRRDVQWSRAKSFDTFCPIGPCLLIDPKLNPNRLAIRSKLNGEVMQESNTEDMIFSVPRLISYLSHQFTLLPGTLIITGTPEGVGCARKPPVYLRDGDVIAVEIEEIGEISNFVEGPQSKK
jgi:2-keto-4-pentenoate hydratase/2-oxohepta-3-ene-1,7-dioic acid hydratase in catechol pathway